MSYAQSLWQQIYLDGTDLEITDNGVVEAIYTIISMHISKKKNHPIYLKYSLVNYSNMIHLNCELKNILIIDFDLIW